MKHRHPTSADLSTGSTPPKQSITSRRKPQSNPPPIYLERALQSLAFWVGYQDSRIPANRLDMAHTHHSPDSRELFEGAISDELTRLLHAHTQDYIILPEQAYSRLVPGTADSFGDARADIVIAKSPDKERLTVDNLRNQVDSIIEIKRANAATKDLWGDIRRLSSFLSHTQVRDARAFLVLVAQGSAPRCPKGFKPYVKRETGLATKGAYHVPNSDITYRVCRLLKAATSFNKSKRAHYVLLFEVERPLS